jgi:hypothetical protein
MLLLLLLLLLTLLLLTLLLLTLLLLLLLLQVQGINIQQTLSASEDPLLLCWSTTGFLLLLLGLLLPAPVWYCLELRSRAAFYKLWQQQQQQQQLLQQRRQQLAAGRRSAAAAAAAAAAAVLSGQDALEIQGREPLAAGSGGDESSPLMSQAPVGAAEGLAAAPGAPSEPPGFNVGEVFEVHIVSLCMVLVASTACSCLVLMSCGPQLLWLQLQLSQVS